MGTQTDMTSAYQKAVAYYDSAGTRLTSFSVINSMVTSLSGISSVVSINVLVTSLSGLAVSAADINAMASGAITGLSSGVTAGMLNQLSGIGSGVTAGMLNKLSGIGAGVTAGALNNAISGLSYSAANINSALSYISGAPVFASFGFTADVVLATATLSRVSLYNTVANDGSGVTLATGSVKIISSGYYTILYHGIFATNSTGERYVDVQVNSGELALFNVAACPSDHTRPSFQFMTYLSSGDRLDLVVKQDSGSSLTFLGGGILKSITVFKMH